MPLNKPYGSPLYNPLYNPPLRSLDYSSYRPSCFGHGAGKPASKEARGNAKQVLQLVNSLWGLPRIRGLFWEPLDWVILGVHNGPRMPVRSSRVWAHVSSAVKAVQLGWLQEPHAKRPCCQSRKAVIRMWCRAARGLET